MSASTRPFRILSIDGGGIRGVYPAAFLAGLEAQTGKRLVDHFDLLVGTSTGGLIALGLAAGKPAASLLNFYLEHGPTIFPTPRGKLRAIVRAAGAVRAIWKPKHAQEPLAEALRTVLGEQKMGDLTTRVVIPTFDAANGEIKLIKTAHVARFRRDHTRPLVEVGLATAAAPGVLPGVVTETGERLLDGGLWANNPVAVGVVEAIGYLGIPREAIYVLSVGTMHEPYHYPVNAMTGGWYALSRARPIDLVFAAQMTGALATAKVLLGGTDRLLRIDRAVASDRFKMDQVIDLNDMRTSGDRDATHWGTTVESMFLMTQRQYPGLRLG
jgi:patatin-like phospholipase/acyl hydrolase